MRHRILKLRILALFCAGLAFSVMANPRSGLREIVLEARGILEVL